MRMVVMILLGLAMVATLGVLFAGVVGTGRSEADPMRSNRLMRWRVILQGISLALFALLLLMGS